MKIKECLLTMVGVMLLAGGWSCQSKTVKSEAPVEEFEEVDCFAKVKYFANAQALNDFIQEKDLSEVTACSDALTLSVSQSFLVIPGKDEIKLYIHRAQKDEYGNIEPVADAMLGYGEVGKPISFVSNFEGEDCPIVVEAVDGVGRRAYWSPAFDAEGNLKTNTDFIALEMETITEPEKKEKQISDKVELPQIGMNVVLEDGEVYLDIEDIDKFKNYYVSIPYNTPLKSQRYALEKMSGKCKGIFVGDIGQNFNPVLCMLMENGGVEILDIYHAVTFGNLMTSGLLEGFENMVGFETGGGGAFEIDGQISYAYHTVYAIDEKGKKKEMRYYPTIQPDFYEDYSGDVLRMTPDGKIVVTVESEDNSRIRYYGRYSMKEIGDKYTLFDVEYQMIEKEDLLNFENGREETNLSGAFQLNTVDHGCYYICPKSGLSFGAPYDERVDFKRVEVQQ